MVPSAIWLSRSRISLPIVALAAFFAAALVAARSQSTHLWTQSHVDEFEKGTPQGVAITSDGHLREAPGLKEILTTPSTFVWSIAVDKSGAAYLGTASPATVLRVGADGKAFVMFETKDLSVQAVRLGPDGALYAATMPSGKVYRLNPAATEKQDDSTAKLVFDLGRVGKKVTADSPESKPADEKTPEKQDGRSNYIWDMTFDASGLLYIATGGPGAVYRVDTNKPGATPELFFKSDEQHIRALA